MTVGHSEHNVTVTAELMNDLSNIGSAVTYTALTIIVTIGSHASGETGLNNWISGLNIALKVLLAPQRMPMGTGQQSRQQESGKHRLEAGENLIDVGRLAGVLAHRHVRGRVLRQFFGIALFLALVEGDRLFTLHQVIGPQRLGLFPHRDGTRDLPEAGLDALRHLAPHEQECGDGHDGRTQVQPQLAHVRARIFAAADGHDGLQESEADQR
jgi:hypothetical protein